MRHPGLLLTGLAVLLAIAFWLWHAANTGDRGGPRQRWFYDLGSHQLFAAPMQASPPIAAPSDGDGGGRNGVLAIVVRTPGGGHEIAYLMSAAPPGRQPSNTAQAWVAAPDAATWVAEGSPQAEAIMQRARTLADGPVALDFPSDP